MVPCSCRSPKLNVHVQAALSGRSPGVTGLTFSVLFQAVIFSVKRAQKSSEPEGDIRRGWDPVCECF
ncbi:hypothetical protein EYF80_041235 [Liparis tanakae]|uniref:Uncharacterized protein n=1 Tax=Liparis tanakae TaxID=230148 RepID=A0A4Z2G6Q6_9TELE|nr:hypothetical protein EYF80_041235 [Liparis tanakae]